MDEQRHLWTVGPHSARDAARAFTRHKLRSRAMWTYVLGALVAACLYVYLTGSEEMGDGVGRLAWSVLTGLLIVSLGLLLALPVMYLSCKRRLTRVLHPGEQYTATFGPDAVEIAGPLSHGQWSFEGFGSIDRAYGWIVAQHGATPSPVLWPEGLFPDDQLDRIRAAVAAHRS